MINNDTIVALATAQGVGAIGVIRLSGPQAIAITNSVFKGKNLTAQPSHTIHYGHIIEGDVTIDEVMVSLFRAPKSFTTEDVVEISCHGSPYIAEQIIRLLIQQGARSAKPGECGWMWSVYCSMPTVPEKSLTGSPRRHRSRRSTRSFEKSCRSADSG